MTEYHNPYPGIRPFRTEESHLFFGRESNIAELRKKLSCRFLSIVGTSGSGKSSLVRAGLIPNMKQEGWLVGTFRPQAEPIKNLIATLENEDVLGKYLPVNFSEGQDASKPWNIADYYRASGQENPLVLVVDQFEEVFRFNTGNSKDKAISVNFVNLLLNAIAEKDLPIYVVITLRSEFLGRCAEFHGLTEWINEGQYLVPRLNRSQFERVILGFKDLEEYKDITISPDLVSKLLNDIGDDMDQLPVLQHSLMRTFHAWELSSDQELGVKHYATTGEMKASVSNHAEDIFKELKYQGLEKETKIIFQRITEVDYESNKVRNPTKLSTLIELNNGKKKEVETIIEAFRAEGRNFLRPDFFIELGPDTMIDVAHESLIRQWRTLNKWMREEAENAREYLLINLRRENQETEGLLLNPRLAISNYWWLAQNPTVTWASRYHKLNSFATKSEHKKIFTLNEEFLEASLDEQEKIDQASKTDQERKKEQQFQRITYLTVGLVVVALILALFSRRNQILKDNAIDSAQIATTQARQADSARLVAINATDQALREKAIADSLQVEANKKSTELTAANLIADNLKDQAIEEREVAESRSIEARLAEIGALISESRAKANEIDANILKLTSEYKEKIEEAKKQALVSIILDDIEEQKENALSSFEKFDQFNTMLMGLRGPVEGPDVKSIDFYVKSIDSVRINLENVLDRANSWIREIDSSLPANHRTFNLGSACQLDLNIAESTKEIIESKLDSLVNLKSSFEMTCRSVEEIQTEREWEKPYPVENHRALVESYSTSFSTSKTDISFDDLSAFVEGSIEINFEITDAPSYVIPKHLAVNGIDQIAYNDLQGNIIIEDGANKLSIPTGTGTLKFINLLPEKHIVVGKSESLKLYNYSHNPILEIPFELSENVVNLESAGNNYFGLNDKGEIMFWSSDGKLVNRFSPLPGDRITAFDCIKFSNSSDIIFALGTDGGRVHLLIFKNGQFHNSSIQLNRLYSGEEPAVKTIQFSPNGHFLATASSRQIDLWPLTQVDGENKFISIFLTDIVSEQISPIPMGRNESIQTSKGLTGVTFDKNGDFIMYANNSTIFVKPVNIYFMCQSLGSDYCRESSLN